MKRMVEQEGIMKVKLCYRTRCWQRHTFVEVLGIWLMGILVLTACSGSSANPKSFQDLQIPGANRILGVEAVEEDTGIHVISSIATYQSVIDNRRTHVLFLLRHSVYDMRLDGSNLRRIAISCGVPIAVAPDGRWMACPATSKGIITMHDLTGESPDHNIIISTDGGYLDGLTWSQDARHLALINGLEGGCSISIYEVSDSHSDVDLAAVLSLPEFRVQEAAGVGCSATNLVWSPDGRQLAFVERGGWTVFSLSLSSLHLALQEPITSLTKLIITPNTLNTLANSSYQSNLSWAQSPDVLAFVGSDGRTIEQVNTLTHSDTVLLTQKTAGIFGLSWTPSGGQLLFVLGLPWDENMPPPSQIYVYTMP